MRDGSDTMIGLACAFGMLLLLVLGLWSLFKECL